MLNSDDGEAAGLGVLRRLLLEALKRCDCDDSFDGWWLIVANYCCWLFVGCHFYMWLFFRCSVCHGMKGAWFVQVNDGDIGIGERK